MATQSFMTEVSSANLSNNSSAQQQQTHVSAATSASATTTTTASTTTTPPPPPASNPATVGGRQAQHSLPSQTQLAAQPNSTVQAGETAEASPVVGDAPLSLTKVLLPAQVVLTHNFAEQQQSQQQQQQQSVLFQALTSHPHFIALVPGQEAESLELQSSQAVPCVQYIDEGGGGPPIFTAPNGHMTTYSVYTTADQSNMYTPNSAAYYNTTNTTESYTPQIVGESPSSTNGPNGPVDGHSYSEQDVFQPIDENSSTDHEGSTVSCYPSSRLSAATMKWLVDNYELAEGMSVPRSTMYSHYLKHCDENKMEPLNAASFGKLIRSVFTGLRTRRLGTRGNSKYHYYGIRLKPSSAMNENTDNMINFRPNPFSHMRRLKPENNVKVESNNSSESRSFDSGERDGRRSTSSPSEKHQIYLGDASTAIPSVEIELDSVALPDGITLEHIRQFRESYRKHCESFLEAVVNFQFGVVENLWHSFWQRVSDDHSPGSEPEVSKSVLLSLCKWKPVQEFIKHTDYQFYQNLVDVLIPEVLRPIPSTLTQAIRTFAKSLEGWLKAAMADCCGDIVNIKVSAISAFAQTLRRYTSLNHLAQAARAVLQSTTQLKQMTADLNRVDFRSVQEQASWVCQCDDETVQRLLSEFRQTLQHHLWLEEWATWLENIVHVALKPYEGKPSYPKAARHFLLKWSFYSSLVIRDLTLRSAASFGSFHLLRLLYDEYMFFIIEHAIAQATGTTSIAVMGEYLCSGKPEELCGMYDPNLRKRKLQRDSSPERSDDSHMNGCIETDNGV